MATTNDITGDTIASRPGTKAYEDGWDRIFGNKKKDEVTDGPVQELATGADNGQEQPVSGRSD